MLKIPKVSEHSEAKSVPDFAIVIPTLNEGKGIGRVIDEIHESLDGRS